MRPIIRGPLIKVPDLEGEIWKDVPNWEGLYLASNLSRVKSLMGWMGAEKILKQPIRAGYPSVTFWSDGKGEQWHVHRLVMKLFKDNPDNLPEVDHLYGDKTDTRLEHLEYVTSSENRKRAYKMGLIKFKTGEDHWLSKLKNAEILEIFQSQLPIKALAEKYNISSNHVRDIKRGDKGSRITGKNHIRHAKKRLTENEITSIFLANGTVREIGKRFNVGFGFVSQIKNRKKHSEVTRNLK